MYDVDHRMIIGDVWKNSNFVPKFFCREYQFSGNDKLSALYYDVTAEAAFKRYLSKRRSNASSSNLTFLLL